MALLNIRLDKTVEAIEKAHAARAMSQPPRPHLGASMIGDECERKLWYIFRWAAKKQISGRLARLFETGHLAEPRFVDDLEAAGVEIHPTDPEGNQWAFKFAGGHGGGSMDGAALGILEAPKTWHVVEMKTHSQKSFDELLKSKVKVAKPLHYDQMQVYMGESGMERAFYLAVNKNTDALYSERIDFDQARYNELMHKFHRIITAAQPLARLNDNPSFYLCKMCDFHDICHGTEIADVNCRTCMHSTPEMDGAGRWSCNKWNDDIPFRAQEAGCDQHRYIPILLEKAGSPVTYDEATDGTISVHYTTPAGGFTNGPAPGLSSHELRVMKDKASASELQAIKVDLAATGIHSATVTA